MTPSGGSDVSVGTSIFGATGRLSELSHKMYKSLSNVSSSAPRETFQDLEGLFCYDKSMKLLLTSAGITNDSIAKSLLDMVGKDVKDIKVAFIPTAANV